MTRGKKKASEETMKAYIVVSKDNWRLLKAWAARNGYTLQSCINEAIANYIADNSIR